VRTDVETARNYKGFYTRGRERKRKLARITMENMNSEITEYRNFRKWKIRRKERSEKGKYSIM